MIKNKLVLLLCAVGLAFSMNIKVSAAATSQRLWGTDRYGTAIDISKNGWSEGAEYAILANGENFPDALSAAPLAKKYNAPILLNPGQPLDTRVESELKRLGVNKVFIIGGTGVVPQNIQDGIDKMNIKTIRLYGEDRYETAVKVAEQLGSSTQIAVANGENFPDAMSMAPIAANMSMPIILTPSNELPSSVAQYIKNNDIRASYVVGGNDVVSDSIFNSLPNAERISGDNRYDTNIEILKKFALSSKLTKLYIANGENFPDALAGSALAAKDSSAVMLVNNSLAQSTQSFLLSNSVSLSNLNILGGEGVVSDEIGNTIANSNNIDEIAEGHDKTFVGANNTRTETTIDGDWIYYVRINSFADEMSYGDVAIYKIKKDGTSCTRLVSLTKKDYEQYDSNYVFNNKADFMVPNVKILKVENGWIYYSKDYGKIYNDGSSPKYKVRVDGTENQAL